MRQLARVVGVLLLAFAGRHALAATINVNSEADGGLGSLRDAASKAQPGDVIVIAAGKTVRLEKDVEIPANVTVQGEKAPLGRDTSTITAATPGANPPPKVVIKGGGAVVSQIRFKDVPVSVPSGVDGTKITASHFDGSASGVTIDGATNTQIGTDANGANGETCQFSGCRVGVASNASTGTTVGGCVFKKTGTGVKSTDDVNVRVTSNTIDAKAPDKTTTGDGIVISGSSGKADKNTITPDKKGGTGITATKGAGSKGALTLDGNTVETKGSAKGVDAKDRTDVTISSATIEGKSSGAGVHCSIGPDAPPGGVCDVENCDVKGCSPGIEIDCDGAQGVAVTVDHCTATNCGRGIVCDMTGAHGATCDVSNDTATGCKIDGMEVFAGPDGSVAMNACDIEKCGSGRNACGIAAGGAGGDFYADALVVNLSKGPPVLLRSVSSTPSVCSFENLTLKFAKVEAIYVAPQTDAKLISGTFTGIKGPDVFVDHGGELKVRSDILDGSFMLSTNVPLVDVAPRGWGSDGMSAEFDGGGNLVVNVPPGADEVRVCGDSADHPFSAILTNSDSVTFSPDQLPADASIRVVAVAPDADGYDQVFGETRVKRPKAKPATSHHDFTFPSTVTIHSPAGRDGSEPFDVVNATDQTLTLVFPHPTGNFALFPTGNVVFQPHETKHCEADHSAMQAIHETLKLPMKLDDGTPEGTLTVIGDVP